MKSQNSSSSSSSSVELGFFFEDNDYGSDSILKFQEKLNLEASGEIDDETVAAFELWKQDRFPELYAIEPSTINQFMFEKLINEPEVEEASSDANIEEPASEIEVEVEIEAGSSSSSKTTITTTATVEPKLQLLLDALRDENDKAKLLAFSSKIGNCNWIGHSKYALICDSVISSGIWPLN